MMLLNQWDVFLIFASSYNSFDIFLFRHWVVSGSCNHIPISCCFLAKFVSSSTIYIVMFSSLCAMNNSFRFYLLNSLPLL